MKGINYISNLLVCTVIGLIMAFAGCTDFRTDERDKNLFDVNNSFVRFDFDNELRGQAKDSVVVSNVSGQTLVLPIALSAPRISEGVRLQWSWDSDLERGIDWELENSTGEAIDSEIFLEEGRFEVFMRFTLLREIDTPANIRLELTQVMPEFIKLGFPGSGRGRHFLIKIAP